jgi:hypothetical protein
MRKAEEPQFIGPLKFLRSKFGMSWPSLDPGLALCEVYFKLNSTVNKQLK